MAYLRKIALNIPYIKSSEWSHFNKTLDYFKSQIEENMRFIDQNRNIDYDTLLQYKDIVAGYLRNLGEAGTVYNLVAQLEKKVEKALEARKGFVGQRENVDEKANSYQDESLGLEDTYDELAKIHSDVSTLTKVDKKALDRYQKMVEPMKDKLRDAYNYIMKLPKNSGYSDLVKNYYAVKNLYQGIKDEIRKKKWQFMF